MYHKYNIIKNKKRYKMGEIILDNEKKVAIFDYEDCDLVVLCKSSGKRVWYMNPTVEDIEKLLEK